MPSKTYTFNITVPGEYEAGINGFTDTIKILVESGEPGGDSGEFEEHIQSCLKEWYDGGDVSLQKIPERVVSIKTKIDKRIFAKLWKTSKMYRLGCKIARVELEWQTNTKNKGGASMRRMEKYPDFKIGYEHVVYLWTDSF